VQQSCVQQTPQGFPGIILGDVLFRTHVVLFDLSLFPLTILIGIAKQNPAYRLPSPPAPSGAAPARSQVSRVLPANYRSYTPPIARSRVPMRNFQDSQVLHHRHQQQQQQQQLSRRACDTPRSSSSMSAWARRRRSCRLFLTPAPPCSVFFRPVSQVGSASRAFPALFPRFCDAEEAAQDHRCQWTAPASSAACDPPWTASARRRRAAPPS
jgi:hypothetical protein